MSDTSQGPGWWLASDGKWYPPDQQPGYATGASSQGPSTVPIAEPSGVPTIPQAGSRPGDGDVAPVPQSVGESVPGVSTGTLPPVVYPEMTQPPTAPPAGYPPPAGAPPGGYPPSAFPPGTTAPGPGYPYVSRPRMNALAVASFVLSIVWIAGLGSLLAVIFGIIALVAISRAHGAQRGRGWAIAGLVIGALGLVLTVTLGVLISHALVARTYAYGTPVTTDSSITGFTNVTVFGIANGVPLTPVSGNSTGTYTVADVRVCVASGGMPKVHEHLEFFLLRLSGGGVLPSVDPGIVARTPSLWQSGVSWLPNQCHRGFLTFVVPSGETPDGVRYNGNILDPIQWTASGT